MLPPLLDCLIMPTETRAPLPVSVDKPSCPPCHGDCSQGDTCPSRLQSTADFGDGDLHHVLLALAFFWLLVCAGVIYFALQ